jgi:hypothetical protein
MSRHGANQTAKAIANASLPPASQETAVIRSRTPGLARLGPSLHRPPGTSHDALARERRAARRARRRCTVPTQSARSSPWYCRHTKCPTRRFCSVVPRIAAARITAMISSTVGGSGGYRRPLVSRCASFVEAGRGRRRSTPTDSIQQRCELHDALLWTTNNWRHRRVTAS